MSTPSSPLAICTICLASYWISSLPIEHVETKQYDNGITIEQRNDKKAPDLHNPADLSWHIVVAAGPYLYGKSWPALDNW